MDGKPLVKSFEQMGREIFGENFSGDRVVEELAKAISTGAQLPSGVAGTGDMTALRLENLDSTMTSVLFQESHLKMFNSIPRIPSAQPLFQWNRRERYGSSRGSVGFREGGAPTGGTSAWSRHTILNKYYGVRGGYTHQALITGQMGGAQVDPVAEENRNRTLELLEKVERRLVFGDKLILDGSANEIHYDGLVKQILAGASDSVVDKKGQPLDFEDFEAYGERLVTTGKLLNFDRLRSFYTPRVLSDLAKLKTQSERAALRTEAVDGYRPGTPLKGYDSQFGFFGFDSSIFLDAVENGSPLATAEASAPAAPTITSVTPDQSNVQATGAGLPVGVVYYFVAAFNDSGESLATGTGGTGTTTVAGSQTTLVIATQSLTTGYRVYRGTKSDGSDAKWIQDVFYAATKSIVDSNQVMPGTGMALILNMNEADLCLAQMAPLIKFPLAIVNTTVEFLLLLYHVLVVKAAERMIVVRNIGARA